MGNNNSNPNQPGGGRGNKEGRKEHIRLIHFI